MKKLFMVVGLLIVGFCSFAEDKLEKVNDSFEDVKNESIKSLSLSDKQLLLKQKKEEIKQLEIELAEEQIPVIKHEFSYDYATGSNSTYWDYFGNESTHHSSTSLHTKNFTYKYLKLLRFDDYSKLNGASFSIGYSNLDGDIDNYVYSFKDSSSVWYNFKGLDGINVNASYVLGWETSIFGILFLPGVNFRFLSTKNNVLDGSSGSSKSNIGTAVIDINTLSQANKFECYMLLGERLKLSGTFQFDFINYVSSKRTTNTQYYGYGSNKSDSGINWMSNGQIGFSIGLRV